MAILQLPVRSDIPAYDFTIDLEGVTYGFRLYYNGRMDRWHMDILSGAGVDLLTGIPILTNTDLIGRFIDPALPPGALIAYDESGQNANAGRYDLGVTVQLLYQESTT